jgi:hypothetical protein
VRHVFGVLGVLAAGVLLAVSAAMNWRFGLSLGRSEIDGPIIAWASVAADCFKALVPFFFFSALRSRKWSQAIAAAVLGVVVTVYSLASAIGHAAVNRNDTASQRLAEAQAYKDLRAELGRSQERLSWIAAHRPPATVQADLERLRGERLWERSTQCTQITGKAARDFCRSFRTLEAELQSGREAAGLEARMVVVRQEIAKRDRAAASGEADPQAAVIAKLLGLEMQEVQFGLVIFVAILLEVGSSMGMYVACSVWRTDRATRTQSVTYAADTLVLNTPMLPAPEWHLPSPAESIRVDVERTVRDFYESKVVEDADGRYPVISLYDGYRAWCSEHGRVALSLPMFVRAMDDMGLQRTKTEQGVLYVGIGLGGGNGRVSAR